MSRPARMSWVVLAGMIAALGGFVAPAPAPAGEDSRTALAFVDELRERGLHELALDYLNVLRADPALAGEDQGDSRLRGRPHADRRGRQVGRPGPPRRPLERGTRKARRVRQSPSRSSPQTREALVASGQALDRARPPGDALERGDRRTRPRKRPRSPRPAPPSPRRTTLMPRRSSP